MAYENGRQINHYAAQKRHDDILKKKFTPSWFDSYEAYYDYNKRIEEEPIYRGHYVIYPKSRSNGERAYYEKWWKDNGEGWKSRLKDDSHRKSRQYERELCNLLVSLIDTDDYEFAYQDKFSDPWNWD